MSSNNRNKNASSSREAQVLERQRNIAMIRAVAAAEAAVASGSRASNQGGKPKPPPPKRPSAATAANRSLSSLTGFPAKGSASNPICINDNKNNNNSTSLAKPKEELKRARPRMKAETVLAQARQRVGSVAEEKDKNAEESKLKRPSVKRPSANRGNIATTAATAPTAKQSGGSLSSILLSNSNTAKYLSKDAPRLLKHYPKVEPDDYWKNLRQWDFVGELNERMADNRGGGKRKRDDDSKIGQDANKAEKQRQPLPDTFQSHREYCFLWSPLLLEENRAQLLSDAISDIPYWRSKQEKSPLRVRVEVRKKDMDGGNDAVGLVVKEVLSKDWRDRMFMANDVVVLVGEEKIIWDASKGNLSEDRSRKQLPEGTPTKTLFGIVGHIEHTRRSVEGLIITISRKMYQQIGQQEMTLLKIGSNVTSLREFTALCRMDRLPLADYILCTKMNLAEDSKPESKSTSNNKGDNHCIDPELQEKQAKKEILQTMGGSSALGKGFADYARDKFNLSQLKGISASATEYGDGGFTLIKGPPGTGKTTTLCALLNALHIRQMNQYFGEVKVLAESYDAVVGKRASLSLSDAAKKRPRILVCAPSNAAVDNIILKIMEDGFIDGNGMRYNPSIVRIGSGQSASVKDVCLEGKVDTYLADSGDIAKLDNTIDGFRGECRRIHSDITKLRQRMNAIKSAAPYPLSKDWEIRIDEDADVPRVYFVNHKDKTTTYEVPPPPEPGERHFPARAMPEFKSFVSRVVKMVERYNNINTKIERYSLCRNAAAALSGGGGGGGAYSRAMNDVRLQLETHILDSVHIVMTTLGTAGNRALEAANKFEVVVIDEAAQSVEPSTLAGLQLGSSHAILVGDPQQLPATIFNVSGRNTKYDRSLFARLEEAGHAVHMLDTQYRMHPAISDFPRRIFYDGKLQDGPNVKHPEYGNPLKKAVFKRFHAFQPFTVLDLESSEERGGTSLSNSAEAQLALHLFNNLRSGTDGLSTKSRVAVITPYAQQAALLRRTFGSSLGGDYEKFVEINTVDAFQGREANIVIFSCVRAAGSKGIGFLSDVRRMNVALTRAKNFLFVIARCSSIVVNPYWRDLVDHARETDAVIKVPLSGSRQSTFSFPDLWTLTVTPAHKKQPMNGDQSGHADNKKENNVIELMGLKLEIPPRKKSNR